MSGSEALLRDLRLSLRQIRQRPGFAAAVIVTLGLAIGANTAIFSFVNALLIRPFPFRDPDQLIEIRSIRGGQRGALSMLEILDIQREVGSIESIAAHTGDSGGYNYSGDGGKPEEWKAILTTGNLFEVLGVPLALGSSWPQPLDRTRDYRIVLTHGVWQRRFGGRPDIVGTTITLDHSPGYRIDGVAPQALDFPRGVEVYRSLGGFANYERRESRSAVGIARIKRPASIAQVQSELDALARRLAERFPTTNEGLTFRATSFRNIYSGDVRAYLLVLMSAVGFVLLIACANVVNLLLSRALSREREVAVRLALGASRAAIVRQMLIESTVLAACAAVVGLGLAYWWMQLLRDLIGPRLPEWMRIEIDARVLGFTLVAAVVAGIVSGLLPALHAYRESLGTSLKDAARGSSGGRTVAVVRDGMLIVEVALAVVLLAGAGLVIQSFLGLQSQDKGFRADSVASFRVALGWKRYSGDAVVQYYERATEQLAAIPGVDGVGFIYSPPLAGLTFAAPNTVRAEGQPLAAALRNPYVNPQSTSDDYFRVMGIRLVAGRFFSTFDRKDAEPVAIVSDRVAKLLWPGKSAIGQKLQYNPLLVDPLNVYRTVVGVVADVQHQELGGEPSLDLYVPFRQTTQANQFMLVKTQLPLLEFQRRAEEALYAIDREQSAFDFQRYEDRILASIWQLRISRLLLILFGGVAIVLSAIGMYSVMSYVVSQRTREMAIRLALGATPRDLRLLVVSRGVLLSALGSAIGVAGALLLGRFLAHAIKGVPAIEPWSVAAVLGALLLVTLAACAIPAWRASRSDPALTLRLE
jgi:putative ABC transport system permease protein